MLPGLATWPRITRMLRGLSTSGPVPESRATYLWVVLARLGWAIGLTVLTVCVMIWIRYADNLTAVPFSLIVLLALLTTAFSGLSLALAATVLACVGSVYFVLPPDRSFSVSDQSQWFRMLASGLIAAVVAVLYELLRRQSQRSRDLAKQLAEANVAKDEFIGNVSHELRTPLTVIMGDASILLREQGQLDEIATRETLKDIAANSERLQRMIENLLVLARAEARAEAPEEPILLHRVVQDLIDNHQRRHPWRQVKLVTSIEATPTVCARESLEQILDNLVANAEKYSPADKPIDVGMHTERDAIVITVADRGPGFGSVDIASLFEPFVRSESAREAAPGLGIGLSVARRLVQAHGGRIWARNRKGGGAEVTFSLPAHAVPVEDDDVAGVQVGSGPH